MQKKKWVFYSFLTFVLFGVTNFILGVLSHTQSEITFRAFILLMVLWIGMGLMGFGKVMITNWKGKKIKLSLSNRIKVLIIAAGIFLALGMGTLKFGFILDPASRGPIVSITAGNAILVAFLSWKILSERLGLRQVLGMFIVIVGVFFLSFGVGVKAGFLAFVFGLCTMLLFGLTNFILKYLSFKGIDSIASVTLLWITCGILGFCLLFLVFVLKSELISLSFLDVILALAAGITLSLGMLTIKLAVARGPAGPVVSIAGSNAFLVTFLDLLFFRSLPDSIKIFGMIIIILGVFTLLVNFKKRG